MSTGVTVTKQIHFSMRSRGRREMKPGPAPITETTPEGRYRERNQSKNTWRLRDGLSRQALEGASGRA
jgi:hypothetical protein